MASFWFLSLLFIIALVASPLDSSSSQQNSGASANSVSPAFLANPPQPLPLFQELSPDITPLLPSPGGVVPTTSGSSIPTIPSSPSPPNPDDFIGPSQGPDAASSPFGSLLASSVVARSSVWPINLAVCTGRLGYWLMQFLVV